MLSGRDDKRDEVVSSLSYDGFGNRLSESRAGETTPSTTPFTSYTYDANNRVVSSSAGELWAYDANGNTTSQTSRQGLGPGLEFILFQCRKLTSKQVITIVLINL